MRRSPTLALLVVLPFLAFLAACGASGGDDSAASTTTTALSSATLAGALPTAADIGPDYEVSDEDLSDEADDDEATEDDDSSDEAIYDACPGAKVLEDLDTGEANPDEVSREFSTDTDKTVEVALDPTPGSFTEAKVDEVVEALADCGTIKTADEDGNEIEMTITADRTDEYGDFGIEMGMNASFDLMGTPAKIEFRGVIFSVDGVTVSVVAASGLDDATLDFVAGDYDLVPEIATSTAERVSAL
jgi:hypothetical protein